jgi:2-aminoadipate transaminase
MGPSDLREILKYSDKPEITSLAGGLPAPEVMPMDEYRRAFEWVLETDGDRALQYGPAEGYEPLRAWVAERMGHRGIPCTAEGVRIVNGSQQALDLLGRLLLNPGDVVIVENPTYIGALQAFTPYQPRYAVVPMDDDGMQVDALEAILAQDRQGAGRVKFIYAQPNFQNPTGRTLSAERRVRLAQLASTYGVPVVEDDPYGELRYEGAHLPTIKSFDTEGNVIYLGTFSKILAPGFRLGWVVASKPLLDMLTEAKRAADFNTASAPQIATYKVVEDGFVDRHIEVIRNVYRARRDALVEAIGEHFPLGVASTRPHGGMFVWAEMPGPVNAREMLMEALEQQVAFVPGVGFHPDGTGANTMRLNFSNVTPEKLRNAARILGGVIQHRLDLLAPTV